MMHVRQAVALVQAFAADTSTGPATRPRCAFAELEPDEVLAAVRGTAVAWALRNVPGTRVHVVGGTLVGVPS